MCKYLEKWFLTISRCSHKQHSSRNQNSITNPQFRSKNSIAASQLARTQPGIKFPKQVSIGKRQLSQTYTRSGRHFFYYLTQLTRRLKQKKIVKKNPRMWNLCILLPPWHAKSWRLVVTCLRTRVPAASCSTSFQGPDADKVARVLVLHTKWYIIYKLLLLCKSGRAGCRDWWQWWEFLSTFVSFYFLGIYDDSASAFCFFFVVCFPQSLLLQYVFCLMTSAYCLIFVFCLLSAFYLPSFALCFWILPFTF